MYIANSKPQVQSTANTAGIFSFLIILSDKYVQCGKALLKPVQSGAGNINCSHPPPNFLPTNDYIKQSVTYLFQKKSFIKSVQLWKELNVPDNVIGDVYGGGIRCNL